jgi:hypothetical protein
MRVLVMARRRFPVPEAELTAMFAGFASWWDYYRDNWEGAWFFAGGAEGFGVVNVPDEAAFHRMMLEWPFTHYFDLEVRPVLGVDEALALWFDETRMVATGG